MVFDFPLKESARRHRDFRIGRCSLSESFCSFDRGSCSFGEVDVLSVEVDVLSIEVPGSHSHVTSSQPIRWLRYPEAVITSLKVLVNSLFYIVIYVGTCCQGLALKRFYFV